MLHLTIGIFGDEELIKKLGKKGTCNDIEIYNHGSSEAVFTFIRPNSEKIQPLLQVIGIIDIPVIVVKELTKEIGEIIIALDCRGFGKGFILTSNPDSLKAFIRGTSLENFTILEEDENILRQELIKIIIEREKDKDPFILVDNAFNVKSIGTVVLGIVKEGRVKKHDKLQLEPLGREILVKSIQSQDRDIEEADAGTRIGLSIKGAEADEIKRGSVICKNINKSKEFSIVFEKSKYCKEELTPNATIFLSIESQVSVATITSHEQNTLRVKTEHELTYRKDNQCIIASTRGIIPRIIGKGRLQ